MKPLPGSHSCKFVSYGSKLAVFRFSLLIISSLYLTLFFILSNNSSTLAQSSSLTLSPAITRITLDDPQQSITTHFTLTNQTGNTLEISANPYHIEGHDPIGRPIISQDKAKNQIAASQVSLNPQSATLFPGEVVQFTATIHPQFLNPGGNYAAILFQEKQAPTDTTHNVIPVITALLHIRNPHGEDRRLQLKSTNLPKITTTMPQQITAEFTNPGNVDITPFGDILATSLFHSSTNIGFLNQQSKSVYPGNTSSITGTITSPPPHFVIDAMTFLVVGKDLENTLQFNHQQQVVYISPILILIISVLLVCIIFLLLNHRYQLIALTRK